jgi:hypothetical protein
MMIKTKLRRITTPIAAIVVIATLGSIGGVAQQQTALALELDLDDLSDEIGDDGGEEREICESLQLPGIPNVLCARLAEALPCLDGVTVVIISPETGQPIILGCN